MKTTVDLPDDLLRTIEGRAASEARELDELVAELLRAGLESGDIVPVEERVRFPLIECEAPAPDAVELTPEFIAEILLQQEVDALIR
jgi:hypothetical protein